MHVRAGDEILQLAVNRGARSLFVVGTGKNVGKTVAMRAIYDAAISRGLRPGVTSIGRDGEAIDIGDAANKPRLFLRGGTLVATARDVLPSSPASEVVDLSRLQTAAGALVYARVMHDAFYELVGPPTASGLREAVNTLATLARFVIVDGAVDRIAALSGGEDAIVVACGAAASPTMEEAVADVRALVARLRVPACTGAGDALFLEGALTAPLAAKLIASNESRVVVVRDPTQILLTGRAATTAFERLTIRCKRALDVVAVTVASIGRDRAFEPRLFAREVERATGLGQRLLRPGEGVLEIRAREQRALERQRHARLLEQRLRLVQIALVVARYLLELVERQPPLAGRTHVAARFRVTALDHAHRVAAIQHQADGLAHAQIIPGLLLRVEEDHIARIAGHEPVLRLAAGFRFYPVHVLMKDRVELLILFAP